MSYTTGTTLFNLDFAELAEEAWERAGREMRSGYDLRTARRSMKDRKSTRLNSSHIPLSRMPSSA
mgnify:CR=1 FL=1